MKLRQVLSSLLPAALALCSLDAQAKSPTAYLTDARDYVLAPLHWDASDWRWVGGAAASIAVAYTLDNPVRDHFVSGGVPAGTDPHGLRDELPAAALTLGTIAVGLMRHDEQTTHTGVDMVEAVVLGTMSSAVFKQLAGRSRPNETASRSDWRNGGDSFPSGHVTAAFAAAQVFADRMPHEQLRWRVLAYGLAAATAYARMDSNVHWLSDTVAGAALGMATGRFVSGRDHDSASRVSLWVAPLDHGALITFNVNID